MKPTTPPCTGLLLFSHLCRFAHRGRLFAGALLLLLFAVVGASAQTFSNDCVIVICPPKLITNYICDDVFTPRSYPIIVSNRCPAIQVDVDCQPPLGTPLGIGAHPIQCIVRANGQVIANCDFTIFVIRDVTPPEIKCPSNIVVLACPGPAGCGTIVNYPPPTASDNSGTVSVTCVPPSGSFFTCGTTRVDCTAEDRCQLKNSCSFDVIVQPDGTAPAIQCPQDLLVDTCSNGMVVVYPFPAVNPAGTTVICNPPSGSFFPLGGNSVSCVASNGCGTAECSFKITVRPRPPVSIQCPTNIIRILPCNSNCVPVFYSLPTVVNGALEGCSIPQGACLPLGNHIITCRATNECGAALCEFTVQVQPSTAGGQPPGIQCPTSPIIITKPCGSNCVPISYPIPGVSNGSLESCNPPPGTCLPVGDHLITCRATNACNAASCEFIVRIVQGTGQPPVITCPSNIVREVCQTNCTAVPYPLPTVSNGTLVSCSPPPTFCFPMGVTTVTCTATNPCSQPVQCSFTVTLRPVPPPTIQCPTNPIVRVVPCGTNCVPVTYPVPVVFNGSLESCNPPQGTCLPVGNHLITCRATNDCGQSAFCEFIVEVRQGTGQPPVITCPSNIVREVCQTNCAVVNYPLPTVSNGTLVSCSPPPTFCFPIGSTIVTCVATNPCSEPVDCKFTVTLRPVPPATIQCSSNIVVTAPCGSNCVPVFYPLPVVGNGALVRCFPPPGTCFPIGITTVTCRATNACGESVLCQFEVRVRPGQGEPPTIQCPNDIVRIAPCGSNCVPVFYPLPVVGNGGLANCNPPPGTCLPVGSHAITCTATNNCGQSVSCSFKVEVRPGEGQPPIIRCPTNVITLTIPCGSNCVPITYPLPFVTNGVLIDCTPPRGTCLPAGIYNVICRASNLCARAECEFLVRIVQAPDQPPVIQCPTNTIVNTLPCNSNCVPISYPVPVVGNGVLDKCIPAPGTCLPAGVYNVICRATNNCGEARCEFKLEVRPGQSAPVIQCPTNDVIFRLPCNSNCVPINYAPPTVINGVLVGCTPPPGTCLPVGSYVVQCRATNNCGEAKCEFVVRVLPLDPFPPSIQCPSNIVVTAPCGSNCVPVFYPIPVVNNGALQGCNPPVGTCLPIGITTVYCRATNGCGLVAECKFDVRVVSGQGEAPGIRCPTNFTVALPCGSNCVPVFYPLPVVTNGVLIACNPPPGKCLPAGNHLITCFASNNCERASCEFIVTVIGQTATPPTIRCPSNIVAVLPCGSSCVPVFYPAPVVVNGVFAGCTPPSGTCLPAGIFNVVCRATNNCGEKAACEFQIRVIKGQGEPPIIQCVSNLVVTAPCGSNCVPVLYPAPPVVNGVLESCNPPPGTCLPVGTNFVTCRATNNCGASLCTFPVIVLRGTGQGPTITCPTNFIFATVPCGSNCVPVFYPVPIDASGLPANCNPPPGTCLPVGNHLVTCSTSNNCGTATCEFVVRVVAGQGHPPIIKCPSNIVVESCSANCEPVTYPLPTVFNGTLAGCTPPPGFCFPPGTSPVICRATNACGSNTCTFTVTVRPVPYPVIHCPSNIIVTTCGTGEFVSYPPPVILGGSASGVSITCTPPSGSFFPAGNHVVRCCAVDRCDRTNCCEFVVTVRPTDNPCVKPPAGMVLWLPFDEPVGPVAANIIPGAPNGGHVNGPVPLIGQYVLNSLGFDGINDFVRVPNYAAIMLSVSDLSIDAWVRRAGNDQGRRVIVSKLRQVAGANIVRGYEYYLNNGVMNLFLAGVATQNFNSGVAVPPDGNWHHVTVTVRRPGAGQVRFYLDGALVNVQGGPIPLPLANSSSLFVGAGTAPGPNGFFRGAIDEVEIFNRALSPAEVFALWNAHQAGKCKVTCSIRPVVRIEPGTCVTVKARICNNNAVPQTINYVASGPAIVPPQMGSVTLPPFTCTNIPIVLCSPANVPPNATSPWTLSVSSETQCPMVCTGLVVNPPVVVTTPDDPTGLPGTTRPGTVRLGVDGLPAEAPLRIRVLDHDMQPDMQYISLNGLPPGVPWVLDGVGPEASKSLRKSAQEGLDVSIQFSESDPGGVYTILIEADLDGDGIFEPLSSFTVENSVVSLPTIRIVNGALEWDDMGDGFGSLESADSIEGSWTPIPGGPGTPIDTTGAMKFYRVAVPEAP